MPIFKRNAELQHAELGQKYRDKITQFEGIATSETTFINGCVRVVLEASKTKENGEPLDAVFDVQRLEKVVEEPVQVQRSRTGGDRPRTDARPEPHRR